MLRRLKSIGPGAMVAAAFIGPGTVVTATKAGGSFGFTLLWAVLFSTLACLVLQEMAARLGVAGHLGLGEAIAQKLKRPWVRWSATVLVIGAILIGNAAYEAGNIAGAGYGFSVIAPQVKTMSVNPIVIIVGIVATTFLMIGRLRLIESLLITLVIAMGAIFIIAAVLVYPNWSTVLASFFTPRIPENGLLTVLGIIGTTVVPYNLFLHATSAKQRWKAGTSELQCALADARLDTFLSVTLGGMITAAILIAAAGASSVMGQGTIDSADQLSASLKSVVGPWAPYVLAVGFMSAGLSSAITAPLAAAFATSEVLGWKDEGTKGLKFRLVGLLVLSVGVTFALLGGSPTELILLAQVANGILLPIIACFLVWVLNDGAIMKTARNGLVSNLFGGIVILVAVALGGRGIWLAIGKIMGE